MNDLERAKFLLEKIGKKYNVSCMYEFEFQREAPSLMTALVKRIEELEEAVRWYKSSNEILLKK